MADGLKPITILGGRSIRLPVAGCTSTRSSLLRDSKTPKPGTATESSSEPLSLSNLEKASIIRRPWAGSSRLASQAFSINVLVSIGLQS